MASYKSFLPAAWSNFVSKFKQNTPLAVSSLPASTAANAGQVRFRRQDNKFYVSTGTGWTPVTSGTGLTPVRLIETAEASSNLSVSALVQLIIDEVDSTYPDRSVNTIVVPLNNYTFTDSNGTSVTATYLIFKATGEEHNADYPSKAWSGMFGTMIAINSSGDATHYLANCYWGDAIDATDASLATIEISVLGSGGGAEITGGTGTRIENAQHTQLGIDIFKPIPIGGESSSITIATISPYTVDAICSTTNATLAVRMRDYENFTVKPTQGASTKLGIHRLRITTNTYGDIYVFGNVRALLEKIGEANVSIPENYLGSSIDVVVWCTVDTSNDTVYSLNTTTADARIFMAVATGTTTLQEFMSRTASVRHPTVSVLISNEENYDNSFIISNTFVSVNLYIYVDDVTIPSNTVIATIDTGDISFGLDGGLLMRLPDGTTSYAWCSSSNGVIRISTPKRLSNVTGDFVIVGSIINSLA